MRKKLVMTALILTMALSESGCGRDLPQKTQEAEQQKEAVQEAEKQEEAVQEAEKQEKAVQEAEQQKEAVQEAEQQKEAVQEVEQQKEAVQEAEKQEEAAQKTQTGEMEEEMSRAAKSKEEKKEEETAGAVRGEGAEADLQKAPQLSDYKITQLEEAKVMYASGAVNVRKGPSVDFERVGGLSRGEEVSVTGQADTGWYEIAAGNEKGYVSDRYLQNEKPAEPEPQPQPAGGAVTEVKNAAGVILVGDSRFVQMQENVGANSCTWIAENGKGYNWLNENAMARIDGCVGRGSKILINLGVNDPEYVNHYLELVNAKAAEWTGRGAKVYYASVNPVWENPYTTEDEVHAFNTQMQSGLSADVHWIDSHTYLESIGFKLVDGLHYNAETYQNIFAYYMSCL